MRILSAAGAALLLSTAISQAAVVDLTYTVEAEITEIRATNNSGVDFEFTHDVGDIEIFLFDVAADTTSLAVSAGGAVRSLSGSGWYYNLDLANGSGNFNYGNADEFYDYLLDADGTGRLRATIASAPEISSFFIFETARYDVLSWSVEGLPDIAPVPLPASLPLLGVGILAVASIARRRRS